MLDRFVAISVYIARRIERCYGRSAEVIYPLVDVARYSVAARALVVLRDARPDWCRTSVSIFLWPHSPTCPRAAARHRRRRSGYASAPRRRSAGQCAAARSRTGRRARPAAGNRIERSCFAAEEDFGIAPLEAQACGTPVIAYCRGGAAETIRGLDAPVPTAVFPEQTSAAICDAVTRFRTIGMQKHIVKAGITGWAQVNDLRGSSVLASAYNTICTTSTIGRCGSTCAFSRSPCCTFFKSRNAY